MSAVQPILERYGAGGFCRDSGPYLLLVRQERDAETASNGERPLTDLIGSEHALEIRLHVYGDPDVDSDEGCDACQHAGAQQGSALVMYLPEPLLLVPSGGLIAAAKDTAVSVWGSVAGWLAGLSGSSGTALVDVTEGASVAVKSAAVLAAAAMAVGGTITVNHVVNGHHAMTRATRSLGATPASTVTSPRAAYDAALDAPEFIAAHDDLNRSTSRSPWITGSRVRTGTGASGPRSAQATRR